MHLDPSVSNAMSYTAAPREVTVFPIGYDSFAIGASNLPAAPALADENTLWVWNGTALVAMRTDPISGSSVVPYSGTNGASPWVAFAKRYYRLTGRGCLFVPCGILGSTLGGTPSSTGHWDPAVANATSVMCSQTAAALAAARASTVPALRACTLGPVLWVGGHNDAVSINAGNETQAQWEAAFDRMYTFVQANMDSGWSGMPMVLAPVGQPDAGDTSGHQQIRASYRKKILQYQNVMMGCPTVLNFTIANGKTVASDGVHPSYLGSYEIGQDMADVAAGLIGKA